MFKAVDGSFQSRNLPLEFAKFGLGGRRDFPLSLVRRHVGFDLEPVKARLRLAQQLSRLTLTPPFDSILAVLPE